MRASRAWVRRESARTSALRSRESDVQLQQARVSLGSFKETIEGRTSGSHPGLHAHKANPAVPKQEQ